MKIFIDTDVIEKDIPLLLSRPSMKRANMQLNFQDDTVSVYNQNIQLIVTNSGHYALPITKPAQAINNFDYGSSQQITLSVEGVKCNKEIALKLHRQFAHPKQDKLLQLLRNAGSPWCNNKDLHDQIKTISDQCDICRIYKKPPPRPVVGLPTASQFQETVAMDLKFYREKIILHLIDHCTRLSASCVIPNKKPETIVKHIFKIWISVFGSPEKFLSDNGGEFANQVFINMCEQLGITVKTTAAESPWSNGIVERHNLIISEMLDKVLEDTKCDFETALAWCTNANNSLANIHGFSPFQLAIGLNPKLPNVVNDRPPALTSKPDSKILRDNLDAIHKAREAFIASENSEKIKRALSHNVRTSGDIKYLTGDTVYYKRTSNRERHGPGRVLGQDGQQVLVKHGSTYIRVHPCRLQLASQSRQQEINSNQPSCPSQHDDQIDSNKLFIPTTKCTRMYTYDSDEDIQQQPNADSANNDTVAVSEGEIQQHSINEPNHDTVFDPTPEDIDEHDLTESITEFDQSNKTIHPLLIPKVKTNTLIKYKDKIDDDWTTARTTSRAGKATGKYANCWNIVTGEGNIRNLDLSRVSEWEVVETEPSTDYSSSSVLTSDEVQTHTTLIAQNKQAVLQAKLKELQQWSENEVYTAIPDNGEQCISLRWVIKPKISDGVHSTKARLCARGFEEEPNFRTDSPHALEKV